MPTRRNPAATPGAARALATLAVVLIGCAPTPWVRSWQLLVERTKAAEAEYQAAKAARTGPARALSTAKQQGASPSTIAKLQAAVDRAVAYANAAEDGLERMYIEMGLTLGPLAKLWRNDRAWLYSAGRVKDWHREVREAFLREGRDLAARAVERDPAASAPGTVAWRRSVRWAQKISLLAYAETSDAHMTASCGNGRAYAAQMTAFRLRELLHEGKVAGTVLGAPVVAAVKRCLEDIGQFPELDAKSAWTFWLDDAQQQELVQRGRAYLQAQIEAVEKPIELAADMPGPAWWRLVRRMSRLHRDLGGGADYEDAVALPRAASPAEPEAETARQTDDRDGDEVRAWIWAGPALQYDIFGGYFIHKGYRERIARLFDAQVRSALLLARAFAPQPGPRGPLAPIALLDASIRRDLSPHLIRAIAGAPAWSQKPVHHERRYVRGREPFDAIADRTVAQLLQRAVRRYAEAATGPYQRAFWHALLVNGGAAEASERDALAAHRTAVDQLERDRAQLAATLRRWRAQPLLEGTPPFPSEAAFALATHAEAPPELVGALAPLRLQRSIRSLVLAPTRGSAGAGGEALLPARAAACELTSALRPSEPDLGDIEPPWRGLDR